MWVLLGAMEKLYQKDYWKNCYNLGGGGCHCSWLYSKASLDLQFVSKMEKPNQWFWMEDLGALSSLLVLVRGGERPCEILLGLGLTTYMVSFWLGLLEPFWKVTEVLIDQRLQGIEFHNFLHGFLSGRGKGTAITEIKLTQQLAYLEQVPLYGIFINLRKVYNAMDRDCCIEIMEAYRVGPNIIQLLRSFWDNAELVCWASGVFGKPFKAFQGVTQGGPVSPRIFSIMVDAIVREWLWQILGDKVASLGLGEEIRQLLATFYADNGMIQSMDPVFLQSSFDILIGLSECVGLWMNTTKTKVMVCVPRKICIHTSNHVYNNMREGLTTHADWSKRQVQCEECGVHMASSSLPSHREKIHGIHNSFMLNRDQLADAHGTNHRAHLSLHVGNFYCPVPGYRKELTTEASLRRHFR